ncbi:hypothetical protein Daus18300_008430 [Diaporthe australafricana]|uniref:Arginase n=1 Tax=Diaporthe australafricana TaxID=127596 RepID=A0ABR3WIF5_9PEZI
MVAHSITLIMSPYHVGLHEHRVGTGPNRIRKHGVVAEIEKLGVVVNIVEIDRVDDFEGEIGRSFELLGKISKTISAVVKDQQSFPIVLAGNCHSTVAIAAGLGHTAPEPAFIWIDAHDDFDTPSTNMNGYLDAMGVSMLHGESWHALMETIPGHVPLALERFVYCGLRDCTNTQRRRVAAAGMDVVWGDTSPGAPRPDFAAELEEILVTKPKYREAPGALVHLDLDVLDDSLGDVNGYSTSGGLLEPDLQKCMAMIPSRVTPLSLTVCSFNGDLEDGDRIAQIAVRGISTFVKALLQTGVVAKTKE